MDQTSSTEVTVPEGTEVFLEFAEPLSSKTNVVGDRFNLRLEDDLVVQGVVVARAGSLAVGEVSHAQRARRLGKGGELNIRIEYMKVGDSRIRLRASKGREGEDKVGATVALTVLFGPLGLLKKGKEIEIPEGQSITAFVDQDTDVVMPSGSP
jgi:hypothetical protein